MKYDILKFESMEYVKVYPNDYKEGEKRPVLILLHGWGPLADRKIEGRVNDGFFPITSTVNKYPFIVLSPLCPKDMWFDSFETLERFVKYAFTAWVNVYETPEVFHWLLEQKNKRVEEGYKRIESEI